MKKTLTLEDIIEKLNKNEEKKIKITHIDVKNFGLMEFVRPHDNDILQYLSDLTNTVEFEENLETSEKKIKKIDLRKSLDISSEFIYKCCPMLQKKEIRDIHSNLSPYDIPSQIFGINETIELATQLNEIFEGASEISQKKETIKN